MNPSKAGRIPKIRGCYECSQRRIDCDRTEPECLKCVGRGLQCSGFGVRYRFRSDVAKRKSIIKTGKRRRRQCLCGISDGDTANLEVTSDSGHFLDTIDPATSTDDNCDSSLRATIESTGTSDVDYSGTVSGMVSVCHSIENATHSDAIRTLGQQMLKQKIVLMPSVLLSHSTPSLTRFVLHYFSCHIASELVPMDDHHNGWRHLVLPIAVDDSLIMESVSSAVAFHFSSNISDRLLDPNVLYGAAIRSLRQRQDLSVYNVYEKQIIVLCLLVLIAATIVNGSSDFRLLFNLLDSAWNAAGGEQALVHGELGLFLLRQVLKYRGYAVPQMSLEEGLQLIKQTAMNQCPSSRGWDDFMSYLPLYPEYGTHMSLIYSLTERACGMYVRRATLGPDVPPMTAQVALLKATLEKFPANTPLERDLGWVYFIAAAESSSEEQRLYFYDLLLKRHRRSGFANVLGVLEFLEEHWRRDNKQNWVEQLLYLPSFVV